MRAIEKALSEEKFQNLLQAEAPLATREQIVRAHPERYFDFLERSRPQQEMIALDGGDTIMSPGAWEAVLRASGAAILAVDEVMQGRATNAFCRVRPPGHHAEQSR